MIPKEPPVHDQDGDRSDGGGSESSRQEDRGSRHRKSRRDKKRDKGLQETSIEDDEAKKERLKEKLRQLEMQMMDEEDEMAGVYSSSGHDGMRRKRRSSSLEDGSDEDGSGRSRSRYTKSGLSFGHFSGKLRVVDLPEF